MSKEERNKIVPKLRFPEFRNRQDWKETLIGEITNVTTGGTPESTNSKYWNGEIPWMNSGELNQKRVYSVANRITLLGLKESSTRLIPPYCVLIGLAGQGKTRGTAAINYIQLCTNQSIASIHPNKEVFNSEFLYQRINSMYDELRALSTGEGGRGGLNLQIIKSLKLFLPLIEEQQKIADCLSSLDELITAQSQKLEALKAHKKGLMQQLFPAKGETVPKLRFGKFRDSGEWKIHTIGDFIESYKGGAPLTPSDFVSYSNYEVIPKKAINEGGTLNLSIKNPTYCSETFYNSNAQSIIDSAYLVTTLRDLVPSGPSIGYIVKYTGFKKYILAQGVYGIKLRMTLVPEFLIHFSNTLQYRKFVNAIMVGSTQVHIRNGDFFKLPIAVPLSQEQQKIADCLSSLDEIITAQAEKIEALTVHKKGLMQQLFPAVNESIHTTTL